MAEIPKGLDEIAQSLGLTDLFVGSLAVYWIRLWFGTAATEAFPGTGSELADMALLLCAAALAGKGISLVSGR